MMMSGPLAGQPGASFPKRFYKEAATAPDPHGFALLLDGKPARTPARNPLVLPEEALAAALAAEWNAVETRIDPRDMPLTRLVNSVVDGVSRTADAVRDEIVRYGGSDLLAYRAPDPAELVAAQGAAWDPVLDWARDRFALDLTTGEGVMFVTQPPGNAARLAAAIGAVVGDDAAMPYRLGALHVITTLTGSALLALAVAGGRLDADAAWAAGHVDEDHQIAQWGADAEAAERRQNRWVDMRTAARLLHLLRS